MIEKIILLVLGIGGIIYLYYKLGNNKKNENNLENDTKNMKKKLNEIVTDILAGQGIKVERDEDGDIYFDYHFLHFRMLHFEDDPNFFYLEIPQIHEIDDSNTLEVFEWMNDISGDMKMLKLHIHERNLYLSLESFVFENSDVEEMLRRALGICEEGYMRLASRIVAKRDSNTNAQ